MITFEEYLVQKNIDPNNFKLLELETYQEFENLFNQVHPNSFTVQKLNLINFIRRKYPLQNFMDNISDRDSVKKEEKPTSPASSRPVFKKKT